MKDTDDLNLRQLDFTLLLVLRALLRHRRTTTVAEELGLSQSAVSHALRRLRRIFGDTLFVRRAYGLEPTRYAIELGPKIDALLRDARAALGATADFDPATTDRVFRLCAPDHIASLLVAPMVDILKAEAPGARFTLRVALGPEALQLLRRDEIDLALGQFQWPLNEFASTLIYVDDYCIIAREDHPRLTGPITKEAFEALDHITISTTGELHTYTDEHLRELGVTRRVIAAVPRFSTIFDIVGRTDAIAFVPLRLAWAYAKPFGVAVHRPPFMTIPMRNLAVRRADGDAGLEWLCERIGQALEVEKSKTKRAPSKRVRIAEER